MSKTLTKYKVVKELGTIFASDVTTEYVPLTNAKNVEFIVATGVGTSAKTKFQVLAKLNSDGSEVSIPYKEKIGQTTYNYVDSTGKEFEIGGEAGNTAFIVISVDSSTLKGLYDRVALNIKGVASSTIPGAIIAATFDPRYSE